MKYIILLALLASWNMLATVNSCNNKSLFDAIAEKNEDKVRTILKDQSINVNCFGEDGYTPLLEAVDSGNVIIVNLLLSRGANPNLMNKEKTRTPLINAITVVKSFPMVKLLLEHGADPELADPKNSPLAYAIRFNLKDIQNVLRRKIDEKQKKHYAAPAA